MTGKEIDYVRETIEQEGFDYAFNDYSDFSIIKDIRFHNLREAYVKAREDLAEYIGGGV